ncbi:hypothetical protein [Streptomyces sp. NL15-2K]|nr:MULTISPECIES: hypothetical protein [Actinomycetes]WKX06108.1 hypothetical protein Q4V64_00810 [Kutzneria buriramensis]GCB52768.1 hypothetical protein SNL152K_10125 [Streptomyces sp. NL15-2K]
MLITPRPGADRKNIRKVLNDVRFKAMAFAGLPPVACSPVS